MIRFYPIAPFLVAALLLVAVLACTGEPATPPLEITTAPPPTATPQSDSPTRQRAVDTPTPRGATGSSTQTATTEATPSSTDAAPGWPSQQTPLNADDLGHLTDDPTELMNSIFDESLLDVGRKMAYSHNDAFIPVIMEFMRFQTDEESLLTLASFIVRIRDRIPEGEFAVVPQGQQNWSWWVKWLAENTQTTGPEGYDGWKGQLFGYVDPAIGEFMYPGVPTSVRLEEIVWGGVARDGIPDLRFPPVIAPEGARYLDPGDRVFGVSINGEHRAYPLRVLNPHEMANDTLGGVQFALAY